MIKTPYISQFQMYFGMGFKIQEVEKFYKRRFEKWLFENSHKKNKINSLIFFLDTDFDENNNLITASYSQVTEDGIPLTEDDFIEDEFSRLHLLGSLNLHEKKRVQFYGDFLKKKRKDDEKSFTEKDLSYKNTNWFKIGLTFASGEAFNLYKQYKEEKGHFKIITEELGFNASLRPYFSESINRTRESNKNIFSSGDKLQKIYQHCIEYNIPISQPFLELLPNELI
jgi:hypothetical protein